MLPVLKSISSLKPSKIEIVLNIYMHLDTSLVDQTEHGVDVMPPILIYLTSFRKLQLLCLSRNNELNLRRVWSP